jgi:hypothetical protein
MIAGAVCLTKTGSINDHYCIAGLVDGHGVCPAVGGHHQPDIKDRSTTDQRAPSPTGTSGTHCDGYASANLFNYIHSEGERPHSATGRYIELEPSLYDETWGQVRCGEFSECSISHYLDLQLTVGDPVWKVTIRGSLFVLGAAFYFTYSRRHPPKPTETAWPDGQKEDNMTNNILKLAQQARTNAQLLTVSQGGIRSLTREDALKIRGDIVEAIRRLQVFEKDLAKKLDT